jgi:hypothetical protein
MKNLQLEKLNNLDKTVKIVILSKSKRDILHITLLNLNAFKIL